MPYKTKRELPDNVKNVLPEHAQDIYKEAFNSAAGSLILPIVSIDGRPIGTGTPGPVTTRLRDLYIEHARR